MKQRRLYGKLGDRVLLCHALRTHALEPFAPVGMERPAFGARVSFSCTRCGTERHDIIDTFGRIIGRRYIYQDGYRLAEKADRPALRREMTRRFASQAEMVSEVAAS